jgi:hypothetical protein
LQWRVRGWVGERTLDLVGLDGSCREGIFDGVFYRIRDWDNTQDGNPSAIDSLEEDLGGVLCSDYTIDDAEGSGT